MSKLELKRLSAFRTGANKYRRCASRPASIGVLSRHSALRAFHYEEVVLDFGYDRHSAVLTDCAKDARLWDEGCDKSLLKLWIFVTHSFDLSVPLSMMMLDSCLGISFDEAGCDSIEVVRGRIDEPAIIPQDNRIGCAYPASSAPFVGECEL
jgi:hypothetical protein